MSVDPDARRRSLEARLVSAAQARAVDVNRLRRQVVFQRIVARLAAEGGWVLKGGFVLEVRLLDRSRATQDIDLVRRSPRPGSAEDLHSLVTRALAGDGDDDGFTFVVPPPKAMRAATEEPSTWRFSVEARMAGRTFQRLKLDVNLSADEVEGGLEPLTVTSPVAGDMLAPVTVPAVDVAQHAAEKLHAIGRLYANDRPSSRVKDLVDLVLLVDAGLLPDPRLPDRLRHVYRQRDGVPPPVALPELPLAWEAPYGELAVDLDLSCTDLESAGRLAQTVLTTAVAPPRTEESPS